MELKLYNTLSRTLEVFKPVTPGEVKMYACGITVQDHSHIGHARQAIVFDVLRKFLEFAGYKVTYIRNFTDVDDKIIAKAIAQGKESHEISEYFIAESQKDLAALKVDGATIEPKVTEHIPDIIAFIQRLVDKGHAYVSDGEVLFDVQSFEGYGKLSNRKLDDQVSDDPSPNKRNPQDFSLWKPAKPQEPFWESPWGPGRPGWHIECSVMSHKYLGETFDIHGGGHDLVFPHHENEIAQSEACTGKPFANYWIHNGLVMVNGQKMSKSLGNFYTIKDALAKFPVDVIRYVVLSHNYSTAIDFSEDIFLNARKRTHYFYKSLAQMDNIAALEGKQDPLLQETIAALTNGFTDAMCDNFNTARVIALWSDSFKAANDFIADKKTKPADKAYAVREFLKAFRIQANLMHLFDETPSEFLTTMKHSVITQNGITEAHIQAKITERAEARKNKDFARSDAIRDELATMKIALLDTPNGTEWDVIFD